MAKVQGEVTTTVLKPSEVEVAITDIIIPEKVSMYLHGAPGGGKSSVIKHVANKLGAELIDLRLSTIQDCDVRGLPYFDDKGNYRLSRWAIPEFFPTVDKVGDKLVIFFLDEFNRGTVQTQNAALQVLLDRECGKAKLGPNVVVIAAGNILDTGCVQMSKAACGRVIHYYFQPDLEDFCKWAVTDEANIHPLTIAFLRSFPHLFAPEETGQHYDKNSKANPSPRTWEFCSKVTHRVLDNPKFPKNVARASISGAVGHGPGIEYIAYMELYKELPTIDAIFLNPAKAPVPSKEPGKMYALSAAIGRRINKETLERAIVYLERLPVEYNVMAIRDAVNRDATIENERAFTKWAMNHNDVIF